jgi:hypothetical protein
MYSVHIFYYFFRQTLLTRNHDHNFAYKVTTNTFLPIGENSSFFEIVSFLYICSTKQVIYITMYINYILSNILHKNMD